MALYKVTSLLTKGGVGFEVQDNRFMLSPGEEVLTIQKNQQIQILEDKGVVSVTQVEADIAGLEYPQYVTINPANITDKKITLDRTPVEKTFVKLFLQNGTAQTYGVAFSVNSSNEVVWDGLSLDGFFEDGDKVLLIYPVFEVAP